MNLINVIIIETWTRKKKKIKRINWGSKPYTQKMNRAVAEFQLRRVDIEQGFSGRILKIELTKLGRDVCKKHLNGKGYNPLQRRVGLSKSHSSDGISSVGPATWLSEEQEQQMVDWAGVENFCEKISVEFHSEINRTKILL